MHSVTTATGILSYFTRHRTAANLLLVLAIAAGLAAFPRMRAQFFPDVVLDSVTVTVVWDGAGAEDVDAGIVEPLEPVLLAVDGVERTESSAREGRATIELEFEPGTDMSEAVNAVTQAVDGVTTLPDEAETPEVSRNTWRDRVTDVVLTGPIGVDQLARLTDDFTRRLFAEGVTRTVIRGLAAPEVVVEVPMAELMRHDITMAAIAAAIRAEAEADPAGDVTGANARLRTGVAKRSPEQIAAIVLRTDAGGGQLTVGDVAQVRLEGIDRARVYFVGDDPAISVRVERTGSGDALDIQARVEEVAQEMARTLPQGVRIDLVNTRSEQISARLNTLLSNAAMGLALVVGLLFLFLNARTALWVAAGIPVAMLTTIALMYAAGLTLNMMSLFALLITLGIVVDDAIVVGEHADWRARHLGEDPTVAAETAAQRMAGPVFSATITTVIAFAGLTAIGGRFGDLIADIPFTVIVVMIASLMECFLILPNHMAHSLRATLRGDAWYDWPSRQVNRGFVWLRNRAFRPLMAGVIALRYPVIAGLMLLLASQVTLLISGQVQWRFFSAPEEGSVTGNFAMSVGADRDDTLEQMRALQEAVARVGARFAEEHGRDPVAYALAEVGGNTGRPLPGTEGRDEDLLGAISVELIDPDLRPYSSFRFVQALQDEVTRHPLLETLSFRGWRSGPGGDAIDVQLSGATSERLKQAAEALKARLATFPEVSALEDTLAYDKEELILDLTPQGAALGLSIDELGRVLRNRLNGIEAATFPVGPRSGAIRVELPAGELTADFLERTRLRTPAGSYVPLADVVVVTQRSGFSTISRENGLRLVSVTGDLDDEDPDRAAEIMQTIERTILPDLAETWGIEWHLSGLAEQERDFLADAGFGFGLCLLGIYLTLAWVFSSWFRPLLIMAVIPFGLIGTIWGHALWGLPMSMFTIIGLIGMSGIIINDSIVLVTTVDDYAAERGLFPAIIDGASDRLRPVLLTSATTVLGLAPLLYEPSSQAQFLKPTVITLVYGLGFGVILVLLLVPALLAMQHDIRRQFETLHRTLTSPRRSGAIFWVTLAGTGGLAGLFALTLGPVLAGGAFPAWLAPLLPEPTPMGALAVFLLAGAALLGALYVCGALILALRPVTGRPLSS